jgi:hypothetical protein
MILLSLPRLIYAAHPLRIVPSGGKEQNKESARVLGS